MHQKASFKDAKIALAMRERIWYNRSIKNSAETDSPESEDIMKYVVYLVEECTGNEYDKGEFNSHFDAEVYIDHHKYSCPKGCYYKIVEK